MPRSAARARNLPLKGVTVVEVSSFVAGPAMGSLLLQLGADVIKVEQPVTGDPSRGVSPWGFMNYNYGKTSLSLNLKSKAGKEILRNLVKMKQPEVFVENMGFDVPKKLGFSYDHLKRLNPGIIYCSIKGFTSKSEHRLTPAFDAVAQALSGTMSLTGSPGGEPVRIGNPSIDLGAAAYGTIEVLGAMLERRKTRRRTGKFIEVSLLDMSLYWNGYWITYYGMTGRIPERFGSGHPGYSPHRVFRAKDGEYVLIATLSDSQWSKLSSLLQVGLDGNYDKMEYRLAHRAETEGAIQRIVSTLDASEVLDKLGQSVPCAKDVPIDQVYRDGELYALGVLRDARNIFPAYPNGTVRTVPSPLNHDREKSILTIPELGQDNNAILKSIGYDAKEIEGFRLSGVI